MTRRDGPGKLIDNETKTKTKDLSTFHDMLLVGRMNRQSSDAVDRSNDSARCFEVLGEEF